MRLETKRLIIKPSTMSELNELHEILNDEETMKFFTEGSYCKEEVMQILHKNELEIFHYSLILKDTNTVVGKISFHPWVEDDTYEIGWIMNKEYCNQGYMTEAVSAMLKYGFDTLHLHRIIATCHPDNKSSARVCEKIGMTLEGHFKESIKVGEDQWCDELFYAIVRSDYK